MRNRTTAVLASFALLLAISAWGKDDKLVNTGAAPAAQGTVHTDHDNNGNTVVDVKVEHMATPQSLTPAKQSYVVWVQPRGKQPEMLGLIQVNGDLKGELKATTPSKDFDIFITAEDNLQPATPSGMVVLKGNVERQ